MHPELAGLLRHACRRPHDPAARMVLADWLEEHGDEKARDRARFIRLRTQLATMRAFHPDRDALAREADALLAAHWAAWAGGLADHGLECDFEVGLTALVLPAEAADPTQLDRFAADPAFVWACSGHCRGWRYRQVQALADWDGLAQFGHLAITAFEGLMSRHLRPLTSSGRLAGLWGLDLNNAQLLDAGATQLARCPDLASLGSLRLSHNNIGTLGADHLASSPYLGALESLDLDNNGISDGGLLALIHSAGFRSLRSLRLESNELTTRGARELLRADSLPALRSLRLGYNTLRSDGVEALACSPLAPQLESLSLRSANALNAGAAALASSPFPRLRHLDLSHNGLDAGGVHTLSLAGWLSHLESLRLGGNALGAEGPRLLATRGDGWALRSLDLSSTLLTSDGVEALLAAGALSGLEQLKLRYNHLDGRAAQLLARFDWPDAPPWLDLHDNRFSETDKALLRDRFAGRVSV